MSNNLRHRVTRIIAGGAHALLDKLEDAAPMAILEQSVREVEAVADEVRLELGRAAANRHLAQQQHLNLNNEHESLISAIEQAISNSRDDLAKPAIARQIDIEAQLPVLETSLAELATQEHELTGFVDALLGKRREMELAIRELEKSRQAADNTASHAAATSSQAGSKLASAQSAFNRTYLRQTGLESLAAQTSLEHATKLKELNDLVRENKIAERLAALKSR